MSFLRATDFVEFTLTELRGASATSIAVDESTAVISDRLPAPAAFVGSEAVTITAVGTNTLTIVRGAGAVPQPAGSKLIVCANAAMFDQIQGHLRPVDADDPAEGSEFPVGVPLRFGSGKYTLARVADVGLVLGNADTEDLIAMFDEDENMIVENEMRSNGLHRHWSTELLPGRDLWLPTTAAADAVALEASTQNSPQRGHYHEFPEDVTRTVRGRLILPRFYDGRALRFSFVYGAGAAGTGDVMWRARGLCWDPDGARNAGDTGTAAVTVTAPGDPDDIGYAEAESTIAGCAPGTRFMELIIDRQGAEAGDTFDQPVRLYGVMVEMT